MTNKEQAKNIAFPSKELAVEEELIASSGTHVDDHKVKASVFGEVYLDKKYYKAKVIPFNKRNNFPKRYDMIIGHVDKVSKSSIRVSVMYLNSIVTYPYFSAIMHISDASRDYINDIDQSYALGDIIRAKIIDAKTYPVQLEAKSGSCGVIQFRIKQS